MNNTEYTEDTLEDRAIAAAYKLHDEGPGQLSVNDWEALRDYAQWKLHEIDNEEAPF